MDCLHMKMMWSVVITLAAALSVESYAVHDLHERLAHGRQLKIYLVKSAESLEFTPADEPGKTYQYWGKGSFRSTKGKVSGTGSDRRWYIDKVTYEDQGTYTQRDYWNKEVSIVKVAVIPRRNYLKCLAGENLYISLEGINLADANLYFSGEAGNYTLVRDGARVSQDISDYFDRVFTHSMKIEIRHVNISNQGRYTLKDRINREVSVTRMDLTDRKDFEGNPLMALLLLLGIPAGICCCCRKKIFKKKATPTTATVLQTTPVHPPASGPVGPSPPYNTPGQPAVYYHGPTPGTDPAVHPPPQPAVAGQWNGPPPSPGFNPAMPPQDPAYPPAGPAMIPPAQNPQWSSPAPGLYPPVPAAPMGYAPAPVMYAAPASEPVKDAAMMQNMAASPTDPLLTAAPQAEAVPPPVAPTATDGAYKFQVDGGTNFL